nr:hypothetical protein [Malonomonas rubra]
MTEMGDDGAKGMLERKDVGAYKYCPGWWFMECRRRQTSLEESIRSCR